MKLATVLLGSAAGLMMASAASAADLPGEAVPAAVDYVKVCDAFGAGFFYIPGTETCLDISGRVRFTTRYSTNAADGNDADVLIDDDQFSMGADARVDFDARTATEFGQLRSFFRITSGGLAIGATDSAGNVTTFSDRGLSVDAAFIQLSYLTVGYTGSLWNDAVLYGIDDAAAGFGDQATIQVVVDDLGGGFFVGAALEGASGNLSTSLNTPGGWLTPDLVAKLGIAGQPWGSVDLSFIYSNDLENFDNTDSAWAAKLTGNFVIADGVNVRATAAYFDNVFEPESTVMLSLAGSVAVSDAATVYAGIRYDMDDSSDDDLFANAGIDYTVVDGLIATAELSYTDVNDSDSLSVIGRLTRNW
jgi:hypothetical protein